MSDLDELAEINEIETERYLRECGAGIEVITTEDQGYVT